MLAVHFSTTRIQCLPCTKLHWETQFLPSESLPLTSKNETSVPEAIREQLGSKQGDVFHIQVEWKKVHSED